MNDYYYDLIKFCADEIYKITDFKGIEDLYWISLGYGDGEEFCYDCCQEEVDKINKKLGLEDKSVYNRACVDGGWGIDRDSSSWCDSCGIRLDSSLTQYGVECEIDHFLENKITKIDNDIQIDLHYLFEDSLNHDLDEEYEKGLISIVKHVLSLMGKSMGIKNRSEILDL